jgi:hypothetical protein
MQNKIQKQWQSQLQPAAHPEEVLSPRHLETLSPNAVRLYGSVWSRMKHKNDTVAWFNDTEASIKARIAIGFIPAARAELVNAGLLEVWAGTEQWKYSYVEQPDYDYTESGAEVQ